MGTPTTSQYANIFMAQLDLPYFLPFFRFFPLFTFLFSYFLLISIPNLLVCDVTVHTFYGLFIAIVIRINFSSFIILNLFCLKK